MNTREFTEEEKTKFEIEERIERLLPIELKNHYRTHIRSILELPERIRHKYTKKRKEFWDNAAQELLSKYIATSCEPPPASGEIFDLRYATVNFNLRCDAGGHRRPCGLNPLQCH